MKKLLFLIIFFVAFSAPWIANAKMMMVDEKGNVVILDTSFTEASEEKRRAIENPGEEIPLISKTRYERDIFRSFFYHTPVKEYDSVVVFKDKKLNTIKKSGEEIGEQQLAAYVIIFMIAIVIMIASNVLSYLYIKHYAVADAVAFAGAVAFEVAVAVTFAGAVAGAFTDAGAVAVAFAGAGAVTFAVAFTFAVAGAVAVTGANTTKIRKYKIYSMISYIFLITAIFV